MQIRRDDGAREYYKECRENGLNVDCSGHVFMIDGIIGKTEPNTGYITSFDDIFASYRDYASQRVWN